jgi:hypothetical protein
MFGKNSLHVVEQAWRDRASAKMVAWPTLLYFRDRGHEMSYVHELSAGKFSEPTGVHSFVCMR